MGGMLQNPMGGMNQGGPPQGFRNKITYIYEISDLKNDHDSQFSMIFVTNLKFWN